MHNVKCLPAKDGTELIMPRKKQLKPRTKAHTQIEASSGEGRYFSRAVGKAIQILELLSHSGAPMSLNDLSRQTQLTKSSALRLLQTLETLRYITRDLNGHYVASIEKRGVVSTHSLNALLQAAREPMRLLNMEFGETVSIAVLMQNHIEVVHVIERPSLMRMSNIVGRLLPPHASSMGKVITAWQDADTRKRLIQSYGLPRLNENTIVDERLLEAAFAKIRSDGHAPDAEESTLGGSCFGVPIFSAGGKVEAAMSLSMPTARMPVDTSRKERLIQTLKDRAQEISLGMLQRDPSGAKVA
jgi:DNA-binding IclR family transcriptional regulator